MRDPTTIILHKKSGMTLADAICFTFLGILLTWVLVKF